LQLERTAPSLSDLQDVVDRLVPEKVRLSDLRWSSIFRIGMRLAGSYRAGNVFIAGDAAHIHPPTRGQGMNTGIQDAYNLAWKMALVLHGRASSQLLDTYEAERRPVGAAVIAETRAQSENLGREGQKPRDRLADTQILVNYRGSGWTKDDLSAPLLDSGLLAGDRAPDCRGLGRENVHFPLRFFDVIRGIDYVLVTYTSEDIGSETDLSLESLARKLKAICGPAIRMVMISARETSIPGIIGVSVLRDNEESFLRTYGATTGTAYLIRPDGYIFYHARPLTESGLLAHLREASLLIASE
jgi:FAD binding domain